LKKNKAKGNNKNKKEDSEANDEGNINKKKKKNSLIFPIREESIAEREDENENDVKFVAGSRNKDTGQMLFYLDENENDNEGEDEEDKPKEKKEDIKKIKTFLNGVDSLKNKQKLENNENDDYLLDRISFLEDAKNGPCCDPLSQIRFSVNNFNNKVYFFPKLVEKLKENTKSNENKSLNISQKSGNGNNELPIPYSSAINILKSIKKYKTPFEKIIIIASLSDQIMENATSFWKDMEEYIEKDYLFIDADEIMSIFLYIVIQTQMPEMLTYCKIIENFTTQLTKGFNFSYNYTLLEASISYVNELKDIRELSEKENGYMEARKSILESTNQKISRISLGLNQG
jgi:hypothetical protein